MIVYHFILDQFNNSYFIWSTTLIQYNSWTKEKDLKVSNLCLIKKEIYLEKGFGYYHELIK